MRSWLLCLSCWHWGCDLSDGSEKPIAYASRTLSNSEANYSQMEREALGIIFELMKFHQYLYGSTFTLVTDQKPLVTNFEPTTSLSTVAATQVQRWPLPHQGTVIPFGGIATENVDCLSRLSQTVDQDQVLLLQNSVCVVQEFIG